MNKLSVSSLLLLLLLFLVEVRSQTFPYVSFGLTGPALADHSYVDLSTVGSANDNNSSIGVSGVALEYRGHHNIRRSDI